MRSLMPDLMPPNEKALLKAGTDYLRSGRRGLAPGSVPNTMPRTQHGTLGCSAAKVMGKAKKFLTFRFVGV